MQHQVIKNTRFPMVAIFIFESEKTAQKIGNLFTLTLSRKRKKMGLGSYPNVTLAEVRKTAQELRIQMANNIDPKVYREKQKLDRDLENGLTFKVVAERMLERDEAKETTRRNVLLEEARKEAKKTVQTLGKKR